VSRAARLVGIAVLAALASPGTVRAESLAGEAQRIDRPRLGGLVEAPQPISIGRAVITPHAAVRVLLAGEEPCGLYVAGPATLSYRIEDPFIRPLAERNFRRSAVKPAASRAALEVTAGLDGALLWGWELAEGLPVTAPTAGGDLPPWAAPLLDRPLYDLPHVDLVLARRLGGRGSVVGLFHAQTFDLRLVVDPLVHREEVLFEIERLKKLDSPRYAGRAFARELVTQPLGRPWWEHELAPVLAEHQSLSVDNDRGRHVTVGSVSRIRSRSAPAGVWWAHLAEEVFEETRAFPVQVLSVEVNGKPADHLFQNGLLLVALEPPLGPGEAAEVRVVHEGEYAVRYGGDSFWSLGTWSWYPTPPFNGRLATMELEVRVPAPLVPFVSGATVASETRDGFTVVKSRLDKPMEYAVVAAGKYHVYKDRQLDVDASVATYARPNERGARRLLYAKGPLVLHALRLELQREAGKEEGERQFWIALRSYLKSFPFTWAGTTHLVAILEKVTGKPWQPWFERYVYGTEMPPLPD
jgi:hypothetical protein